MKERYTSRISELLKGILGHLPTGAAEGESQFVERFYAHIPIPELEMMAGDHASELARDAYTFLTERTSGEPKIRIFTPSKERNGYELKRLVVEIINDDMPFLVDSLTNELTRMGFTIFATFHPIVSVLRDDHGKLKKLLPEAENAEGAIRESFIHFEISGLPDDVSEQGLEERLRKVLRFVYLAVVDWKKVVGRMKEVRDSLPRAANFSAEEITEAEVFIDWLINKNFVFLGYAEIDFSGTQGAQQARLNPDSFLGVSKVDEIPAEVNVSPQLVDVRKASRQSLVHRRVLMDVVTVKRLSADGKIVGEHRFYGLFTSAAYYQSAITIPLVERKIRHILARAGFDASSHNGKALQAIVQFLPRDELFQIGEDDLFDLCMGILGLESRPGVKLFARVDVARRYISVLVFVPKELFSTDVRKLVEEALERAFRATKETYQTQIDESPLARLHVVLRTSADTPDHLDIPATEQEIATAIMLWSDRLKTALIEQFGEHPGERLFRQYATAFPPAYTHRYDISSTLYDIRKIEACLQHGRMELDIYRVKGAPEHVVNLKLYNPGEDIALSDILPLLEHTGLRVLDEFPYQITPPGDLMIRMRDIRMQLTGDEPVAFEQVKPLFEALLLNVWNRTAEDDRLNALVFRASLTARQIGMLRGYTRYLKQIGFTYGLAAMEQALIQHAAIARLLVGLFEARFDPEEGEREQKDVLIHEQIEQALTKVTSLSDDRILRTLMEVIGATIRTNYFCTEADGAPRPILSFKFDSARVPGLPLPKPQFEIFVYSPRVEGIHLRGGKVARGGLRWSDRHEDFRTEVLGLMKAQMVKNAVIVPVGSKGGFVVKQVLPANREAFRDEGVECYKLYLQGLLDITDNIVQNEVVPPARVVRYDEDDPYLVVAADKGTASFSDIANDVSQSYGFWLDDAFASGGSVGYDHKKMGITARGAWVSVERHFREMGVHIGMTPFTVAGIGDMSGDVFGNGMLLSRQIRLVAAFNHLHIFLDPTPDTEASYAERKRLFELPRSGWLDYKTDLISKGGGIFERSAKVIALSPEIREALGTELQQCSPDELIQIILKSSVDLLWNGGIGTYVKATDETHDEVGDRTNNAVRINGSELRAKIVGEGGNLGLTQKGRIEYARAGGRINTDAIDNSGGVDCSDHEVNIKIALQGAVAGGKLTLAGRNDLLAGMTDEVAGLVLRDNALQTQAITTEELRGAALLEAHTLLIRTLEARGLLNRAIEFLPTDQQLSELRASGRGLVRPQIAVLLAYSKIALFKDIVESGLPDEPYFADDLARYFPRALKERFGGEIKSHPLKREIIATVATNSLVNRAGISFYFNIAEDTQLPARDIVAAYSIARDVFELRGLWSRIEALSGQVEAATQVSMHGAITGLLTHVTHWILRHQKLPLAFDDMIASFAKPIHQFTNEMEAMHSAASRARILELAQEYEAKAVPVELARHVADMTMLYGACDVAEVAEKHRQSLADTGRLYVALGEALQLDWLRAQTARISTPSRWDRLALQSLVFDLYDEQRRLSDMIFTQSRGDLAVWLEGEKDALARYHTIIDDLQQRDALTTPMIMVAFKQLSQVGG